MRSGSLHERDLWEEVRSAWVWADSGGAQTIRQALVTPGGDAKTKLKKMSDHGSPMRHPGGKLTACFYRFHWRLTDCT